MTTPSNGGRNGLAGAILDRVFAFVDKPWKGLFILTAILAGAIGFAVWEERAAFVRLLSRPQPAAMRSDLVAVALDLLSKTTAEAVSVWSVNLGTDIAQLLVARRRGGEIWLLQPTVLAAIHEASHRAFLTKVIRGEPVCADPQEFEGPLGQSLVADGWHWVCVVPEPPSSGDLLIGAVLLAWAHDPGDAYGDQAIGVARSLTDQILTR